jgi:hypothetical protein
MKIITAAFLPVFYLSASAAQSQTTGQLTLQSTIELPGGTTKFDHFAIDLTANHLFIASTGNQAVEVLDLNSGKVASSLIGFGKPHGLAWVPASGRLFASDGSKADLKVFEGAPLAQINALKLSDDADDMVYDAKTKLLYVGHGGSDAANPARIAVIDTNDQSILADLPVAAHPEGLEIDTATDRVFANIADAAQIVVIDGRTHTQAAVWKLTRAKENVPLAYDEEHQILFVACRAPARMLVVDGKTGNELADLPADAGADDMFYDAELHRVYVIAGSGTIDAYEINAGRNLRAIGITRTSSGAKTGLLVPSQHALYIGAPSIGGKPAEIMVYATQ